MAGLDPAIHVFLAATKDVDARVIWREDALLHGHDEFLGGSPCGVRPGVPDHASLITRSESSM
jgi:hypothetical protein